jgi:hypothetical protein
MEKTLNPRQIYLQMHVSLELQRTHSTKAMVRVCNYCVCYGHTKKQMCVCVCVCVRERERETCKEPKSLGFLQTKVAIISLLSTKAEYESEPYCYHPQELHLRPQA